MSLPIYQRVAVTDAGDVIPGAEYTVINENTGVAAPIYSDRTGATLLTAPYFADSAGTIQFYIAAGTTFRVAASGGVGTYTDRYIYAAHPQSNPTDTTSGSLMAVGAGGLLHLGNSGLIAAATLWPNASLLDVTGVAGGAMYGVLGITNSPANADGSVFVFYQSSVRVQIIFYDRASPRIWFNQSYNSGVTFQGWNEVITANAAGNVGIGTISPTFKLDVAGNARASYFALRTNEAVPAESAFMYRPSTGVLGFGVTSAEKMRIDSSGNVGINTISPSAPLQVVSGENLVAKFSSSDGTSGIRIEDTTTSYDFYVDSGNLRINNTAGLERLRIDAAGDVEFSSGNGGIYLGGRAAANRLDHYEEGTWTPTVGGTWSTAPTALSGTYIKIGSLVYVKVNFSGGAKTSATTGWIDGNPFNQVGGGSTGSVSDSSVSDRGNCLFANTTRIWLTSTSFSGGANYLSGSYNTDA